MQVDLGASDSHEAADSPKVPERIHALLLLPSVVPAAQQALFGSRQLISNLLVMCRPQQEGP